MTTKKYKDGSFLRLAQDVLGSRYKRTLKRQYLNHGTKWMAKHWGYGYHAIQQGLKRIGVELCDKGGHFRFNNELTKRVKRRGGYEKIMESRSLKQASKYLGISENCLKRRLLKEGFICINKNKGKWIRSNKENIKKEVKE